MDDAHYIRRVLEGDVSSFAYLVEEYKDQALALSIRIVKDHSVAEDILQDAFISAFNNLAKYRGDAAFKSWFLRIVYNESVQFLRKQKVEYKHKDDVKDVLYGETPGTFDALLIYDQQRIIEETFQKMEAREAAALQLFYLEELSIAELEEVMGLKKAHIKVILYRARKAFYAIVSKSSNNTLISLI